MPNSQKSWGYAPRKQPPTALPSTLKRDAELRVLVNVAAQTDDIVIEVYSVV